MAIPAQIVEFVGLGQSPVSSVILFEPGIKALQEISGMGNVGILQVMKHIGKGIFN